MRWRLYRLDDQAARAAARTRREDRESWVAWGTAARRIGDAVSRVSDASPAARHLALLAEGTASRIASSGAVCVPVSTMQAHAIAREIEVARGDGRIANASSVPDAIAIILHGAIARGMCQGDYEKTPRSPTRSTIHLVEATSGIPARCLECGVRVRAGDPHEVDRERWTGHGDASCGRRTAAQTPQEDREEG